MKHLLISATFLLLTISSYSQKPTSPPNTRWLDSTYTRSPQAPLLQYAQVTALESQVSGGLGRSRLIVTYPDGKQVDSELQNYKSMTGINFSNVLGNEKMIVTVLNKMSEQGFEIRWVESGVSEGIYITKYVMVRREGGN